MNLVINSISDEVTVGEIRQQNMEIHDEAGCVDASLEFVDQNSKGSIEDFSKTMEKEWRTISKKKKKVLAVPITRPVTRASKPIFK